MKTSIAPVSFRSRSVERTVRGQPTSDGDGVKLTRVLTQPLQRRLDPFLMLDAFGSDAAADYIGGFPDHPHRGFETVTIMLEGRMRHDRSAKSAARAGQRAMDDRRPRHHPFGDARAGGGRMAASSSGSPAAKDKLQPPAYRDIAPDGVPVLTTAEGVTVRVIAGAIQGVAGAVEGRPPSRGPRHRPARGQAFEAAIAAGHNAFAYVYEGEIDSASRSAPTRFEAERMAVLSQRGRGDRGPAGGAAGGAAAAPRGLRRRRPAARRADRPHGPFVMNTTAELQRAVSDFQRGVLAA